MADCDSTEYIEIWLQVDGSVISVTVDAETAKKLEEDNKFLQQFGRSLKSSGHIPETEDQEYSTDEAHLEQPTENLETNKHDQESEDETKMDQGDELQIGLHICDICKKEFSTSTNLNRHLRNIHKEDTYFGITAKLTCAICEFKCNVYSTYCCHLEQIHSINIEYEYIIFQSESEFIAWKKEQERSSKASFFKKRSDKLSNGWEKQYFYCHRSGYSNVKKDRNRALKAQGSCRINKSCPARISVIKYMNLGSQSFIEVEYVKTHIGHSMDLGHIRIAAEDKLNVATKLMQGVSFNDVLYSVRNSIDGSVERIHLLTRKDIHNIASQFKIHNNKSTEQGVISIDMWVKEMNKKGNNNPVLMYKPQGAFCPDYPTLQTDDFILGIMTTTQIQIFQLYGRDIISLDSTHGTNAFDFCLTTVMVLDELRQGFPVAFLISNKQDENTLILFFECIKNKAGLVKPQTVMTDISESLYSAWLQTMGSVKSHIFCTWHVDRAWRKKLCLIENKEEQGQVYKILKALLEETDKVTFSRSISENLESWLNIATTKKFAEYFLQNYWDNVSCWAYCYRRDYGINANVLFEAFHKVLKTIHLKSRKGNKQLDTAIHTLMKFIRDKEYERLIKDKEKISNKLTQIQQRHEESECVDFCDIILMEHEDDIFYLVSSTSGYDEMYEVRMTNNICQCSLICNHCNICIHKYTCTCLDYCISWNICKHIHLVCCKKFSESEITNELIDTTQNNVEHLHSEDKAQETVIKKESLSEGKKTTVIASDSSFDAEKKLVKAEVERLLMRVGSCNSPLELNTIKHFLASFDMEIKLLS